MIEQIEDKQLVLKMRGKSLTMKKAISQIADKRNKALRAAEEELKKHTKEKVVIQWGRGGSDRGVTVNGVYAFEQESGDDMGQFVSDFAHLKLPA